MPPVAPATAGAQVVYTTDGSALTFNTTGYYLYTPAVLATTPTP